MLWGRVFVSARGRLELTLASTDWVLSYSWLDYCRHAGCPTECPWTCALCAERQVKMDSIVWVLFCSGNLCLCSFISNLTQFSENISDFLCFMYGTIDWTWGLVHTRQIAFYWVTASIQMFLKWFLMTYFKLKYFYLEFCVMHVHACVHILMHVEVRTIFGTTVVLRHLPLFVWDSLLDRPLHVGQASQPVSPNCLLPCHYWD